MIIYLQYALTFDNSEHSTETKNQQDIRQENYCLSMIVIVMKKD